MFIAEQHPVRERTRRNGTNASKWLILFLKRSKETSEINTNFKTPIHFRNVNKSNITLNMKLCFFSVSLFTVGFKLIYAALSQSLHNYSEYLLKVSAITEVSRPLRSKCNLFTHGATNSSRSSFTDDRALQVELKLGSIELSSQVILKLTLFSIQYLFSHDMLLIYL